MNDECITIFLFYSSFSTIIYYISGSTNLGVSINFSVRTADGYSFSFGLCDSGGFLFSLEFIYLLGSIRPISSSSFIWSYSDFFLFMFVRAEIDSLLMLVRTQRLYYSFYCFLISIVTSIEVCVISGSSICPLIIKLVYKFAVIILFTIGFFFDKHLGGFT